MTEKDNEYALTMEDFEEVWDFRWKESQRVLPRTRYHLVREAKDGIPAIYDKGLTYRAWEYPAGYLAYRLGKREVEFKNLYQWLLKDDVNWFVKGGWFPNPPVCWKVAVLGDWNHFAKTVCRDLMRVYYKVAFYVKTPNAPLVPLNEDDYTVHERDGRRSFPMMHWCREADKLHSFDAKIFKGQDYHLGLVLQDPVESLKERVEYFIYDERKPSYPRSDYVLVEGPLNFQFTDLLPKDLKQVEHLPSVLVAEAGRLHLLYGGYYPPEDWRRSNYYSHPEDKNDI